MFSDKRIKSYWPLFIITLTPWFISLTLYFLEREDATKSLASEIDLKIINFEHAAKQLLKDRTFFLEHIASLWKHKTSPDEKEWRHEASQLINHYSDLKNIKLIDKNYVEKWIVTKDSKLINASHTEILNTYLEQKNKENPSDTTKRRFAKQIFSQNNTLVTTVIPVQEGISDQRFIIASYDAEEFFSKAFNPNLIHEKYNITLRLDGIIVYQNNHKINKKKSVSRIGTISFADSIWDIQLSANTIDIPSSYSKSTHIILILGILIGPVLSIVFLLLKKNMIKAKIANERQQQLIRELDLQKFALDEHAIVAVTDKTGIITYVNDKFCKISQYKSDELIGKTHRVINSGYHKKDFFVNMWKTISSGNIWRGEVCNRAKDGTNYWVDTTIVPFLNETGSIDQYIAIRADITSRKQYEDDISRKNEELEQFVYSVSHDLKSPIVTQMGYIDCLKDDMYSGDYEQAFDSLKRIEKAVTRMRICVDNILEIAKIGRVNFESEVVEVGSLIDELKIDLASVLKKKNIDILVDEFLPKVHVNKIRLMEVFENLIHNAIKYAYPDGGGTIHIGSKQCNDEVHIFIRDYGPGIPKEYHNKIFALFHRLQPGKSDGTGIGLTLVKRIMQEFNGRVWVESTKGHGATFWLAFPDVSISTSIS